MERKIAILKHFFEDPVGRFSIRDLSRRSGINHTTVRQYLNAAVGEGILSLKREGVYSFYRLVLDKKALNLKLYYNLEKIRKSGIVEHLERYYDFPVIVLFGSYAYALDGPSSDVDMCVVSNVEKDVDLESFEEVLGRTVSIHRFTKTAWNKAKVSNPGLVNNICNGIVLSGELEVV